MTMLLKGGFCNESISSQPQVMCSDFVVDGREAPRPGSNDTVYLVVTGARDPSTIQFQGSVRVGNTFTFGDPDQEVAADTIITMYADEDINPSNILQSVQFHSSGSQILSLKDTYGASEVAGWVIGDERTSIFESINFTVNILNSGASSLEITSVTGSASWRISDPNFDFSDRYRGEQYGPGEDFDVSIVGRIDRTVRQEYNGFIQVEGVTEAAGECVSDESFSFLAGS